VAGGTVLAGLLAVVVAWALLLPAGAAAQAAPGGSLRNGDALRVFFECRGRACDTRQFRTEIDWVNWVRDRQDAQVHVIVTSVQTGSGGERYNLDFIGLEELEGREDELTFTSLGTDVRDEEVRGLQRVLAVGLTRFSILAGAGAPVDLVSAERDEVTDRLVTSDEVDDPWDFWVFEIQGGVDLSGETSRQSRRFDGGLDVSRITTTWKIEFEADGNWRRAEIELSDTTIVDSRRDWDTEATVVYSLADHWSLGGRAEVSAATRTNQDLSVSLGPRVEYSVWPYEEAPRRSLAIRYDVGVRYFDYEEVTIFGRTEEIRPVQGIEVALNQRQPWGSVFANAEASHYLHDPGKYRVSTGGFLSFRVLRGLNLRLNGRASWIRDQLFLSGDVTDEEILLERRRLASNFDWDIGVGFSFQFGSIYNNVVNNRF
ncbi:MAG: hypothetical protein R3253_12850, partial [Longimicrobiales bacterium]|nr:hypothetical protein [Longimicrobiales bacterium]